MRLKQKLIHFDNVKHFLTERMSVQNTLLLLSFFTGVFGATGNLNHLGIKTAPSKSSISYQNGKRDADLFKDVYFKLLEQLGQQIS